MPFYPPPTLTVGPSASLFPHDHFSALFPLWFRGLPCSSSCHNQHATPSWASSSPCFPMSSQTLIHVSPSISSLACGIGGFLFSVPTGQISPKKLNTCRVSLHTYHGCANTSLAFLTAWCKMRVHYGYLRNSLELRLQHEGVYTKNVLTKQLPYRVTNL